jgi:membrane dipeptidase
VPLDYTDHRNDPEGWARALGVSREAVEIYLASDVIDLHVDTFIWTRIFGYDLTKRHDSGLFRASFYGHADLPRLREAQVGGAVWVISTNPVRPRKRRAATFFENLARLRGILESCPDDVQIVRNTTEYRAARKAGKHAAFIGIQGGNALDGEQGAIERIPDDLIIRVTLVHLSNSALGATSAPGGGDAGLTPLGREYVKRLDAARIFVDLAHINRRGFFDAIESHDRSLPVVVTHTGVSGVHPHWRNLDDEQVKAVAATGGTIGIMYQATFLGDSLWGGRAERIVDHLEHVVKVAGEDFASLGSDWDGAIVTPRDMPTCLELPKLVEIMLSRGWSAERIHKIMGGNWLRAVSLLRN